MLALVQCRARANVVRMNLTRFTIPEWLRRPPLMVSSRGAFVLLAAALVPLSAAAAEIRWQQLSSKMGELPVPGESTQQTGAIVADLDKNGVNDFVLSFREKAPALVWYRRTKSGWDRYVIEKEYLTVEAGGAVHDIDGDGNPDIVFGADFQAG